MGKPFYQRNHYTCSSFIARLLENNGVLSFSRHFSLITPRDFYEYGQQNVIYEGTLRELCIQVNAGQLVPGHYPSGVAYEICKT